MSLRSHLSLSLTLVFALAGCVVEPAPEGDASPAGTGNASGFPQPSGSGARSGSGGVPQGGSGGSAAAGAGAGGALAGSGGSAGVIAGGSAGSGPTAGGPATSGGAAGSAGAEPGDGGDSGASPSAVWRPYSAESPWNTPIAADARIDPNSAALIDDFQNSSQYGEHLDVNLAGFSIPLYYADASTPKVTVTCRVGGHGFSGDNGMNASAVIPIPRDAAPDPQSDHHLLIIDRSTSTEYGLWDAQSSGGSFTCGLGALQDLSGDGVRPLATEANPWWEAHGPRACGFGLVAGLIRPEEIEAGRIDHALVVAYPHIRAGWFVPPASTAQAANGAGAQSDRGIPCGGRIQYDPSIDVSSLDVSPAGKTILRALQVYGAYVGDYSGAISLYADNSPDARAYWDSIGFDTYELDGVIDLADFRVLEIGQMYDNGNG